MSAALILARAILGRVTGWLGKVPLWVWPALALLAFGGVQTLRLHASQGHLATAKAELVTCAGNTDRLTKAIRLQNAAVDKLKADGAAIESRAAAAYRAGAKAAASHTTKATALVVYTPKGADACAQLVDLDREVNR